MSDKYVLEITHAIAEEVLGQRIVEMRHQTDDERDEMGWDEHAIVFVLENGHRFIVSKDEEGNGPGALFTTVDGAAEILVPV